jgi:hypothetical protein
LKWPARWALIAAGGATTTLELYEVLRKKYYCARCGRRDLPLALFFEHDQSCSYESAITKSSCELVDEINDLEWRLETAELELEKLRPKPPAAEIVLPEVYACDKCKGRFDREHMRYVPNGIACEWCYRHLP